MRRARVTPRRQRLLAGCVALAVAVAGCGGGSSSEPGSSTATSSSRSATASRSASTAPRRPRRRSRPRGAPVGRTQKVHAGASTLDVTVTRLLDPLREGAGPPPGTRAVAVQVTIRNVAGATYDSTASGDWGLLTSGGVASPLFVRSGVCQTQLVDFESLIGAGETRSGCVAFSVARHARVLSVTFSPHSRARGRVAWR